MINQPQIVRKIIQLVAFILLVAINGCITEVKAQVKFNSEKVRQLFQLLPEATKNEIERQSALSPGTFQTDCNISGEKQSIVYRFNQYRELDHLGVYLIHNNIRTNNLNEVFDYVERAFLASYIQKEKLLLSNEISEKKLEVLYNGGPLNRSNSYSVAPKISVNPNTPLKISTTGQHFVLEWKLDNSNFFSVKIPNNYQAITEKTKDELEKDLLRKLKSTNRGNFEKARPTISQLKLTSPNIYLLPGEIYSTTPELSSNKYFSVNDSVFPVFNSKSYKESIRNLFLNMVPTTITLKVTLKLYGGVDERFSMSLNAFLATFSSDYKLYFGWQNDDRENLKASLFISSKYYNFNHLLVITANSKSIFRKNGEAEGLLLTYIPRENPKLTQ